jgi:hypothetical protein
VNKSILQKPFPPELVKQRQGQGGKTLNYVETHAVIARLNEGCEAWSFEIVEHQVLEDEVVVVGKLVADGVVKMAFGGSGLTRDRSGKCVSVADDLKSAGSDALKKAASLLGVALELYGATPTTEATPAPATAPTSVRKAPCDSGERLTSRQLSAVIACARKRGLGPEALGDLIGQMFGPKEPAYLSRRQASQLLDRLHSQSNGAHA